jgi:hypothetical protein
LFIGFSPIFYFLFLITLDLCGFRCIGGDLCATLGSYLGLGLLLNSSDRGLLLRRRGKVARLGSKHAEVIVAGADIAIVGRALGLDPTGVADDETIADAAIGEVSRLFAAIGIAPTLAGLGLPEDRVDWAAEQALGIGRLIKNNPRSFDAAAMRGLVRAAYDGDLAASAL